MLAYFSAGGARRSTSFAHVFQLYGGFLLRAVAMLKVLAAARLLDAGCFLVSLLHASASWTT